MAGRTEDMRSAHWASVSGDSILLLMWRGVVEKNRKLEKERDYVHLIRGREDVVFYVLGNGNFLCYEVEGRAGWRAAGAGERRLRGAWRWNK